MRPFATFILCSAMLACGIDDSGFDPSTDAGPLDAPDVDAPGLWQIVVEISAAGDSGGSVNSSPGGISCPGDCAGAFDGGTTVTLSAAPNAGSVFTGWEGAPSCDTSPTCEVSGGVSRTITANFASAVTLSVLTEGSGTGTVESDPSGIDCGDTCAAEFAEGSSVQLTATPAEGSRFDHWSEPSCGSAPSCEVTLAGDQQVVATFVRTHVLDVLTVGAGTVSSVPAGIDCGASCSQAFDEGTTVVLTAAPDGGFAFTGWDIGSCGLSPTCEVTMDGPIVAQASFTGLSTLSLVIAENEGGSGSVTIAPPGQTCVSDCDVEITPGTMVTLTASPDAGSRFVSWDRASCGTALTCTIELVANTTVTATFLGESVLNVTKIGSGDGSVESTPAGISCGGTCSANFDRNSMVTLNANPSPGSVFRGWTGCAASGMSCVATLGGDTTVTAEFVARHTLSVARVGNGTVNSSSPGIACGSDCSESYDEGTSVTLTAVAQSGFEFTGWSGDCSGMGTCSLTMNADRNVTANFVARHTLTVTRSGDGTVSSTPAGISCGSDCTEDYDAGTAITLTATPASGFRFTGWSGDCSGTGACNVVMNAPRNVTATFVERRTLRVDRTGNGTVTSTPSGISCGGDCNEEYDNGTMVTLTASPNSGFRFAGWGGACSGTGSCTVTMNADRNVTAEFVRQRTLNVSIVGDGSVSSSPAGINCGSDCTEAYDTGTTVTLTATPDAGYVFVGWSGASCSGTGTCEASMTGNRNVTATFEPEEHTLTVTAGAGGSVSSSPGGISCGSDCTEDFVSGTSVSLSATPNSGFVFSGWSGAGCSGTGSCTVSMSTDRSVTAAFAAMSTLSVNITGAGDGTITSSPAGIDCGSDCNEGFAPGTSVTLSIAPGARSSFSGWSGDCSGSGPTCSVTVSGSTSATATFDYHAPTYLSLTNHDPEIRLRRDALAADLDPAGGSARSDTPITSGSGVFYVEGHRLTGAGPYGMQIAAQSSSVNNQGCGTQAGTVGFNTNGGVTEEGAYATPFNDVGDRYGFVVDYRGSNPIIHTITLPQPWLTGSHTVVRSTTLSTTEDLYVDVCGLRHVILSELEVNFGNDTTNFPFGLDPDAILRANSLGGTADALTLGWARSYAGPVDAHPTISHSGDVSAALGSPVTLTATASDAEDGAIGSISWEVLTSPYYLGRETGTGASFTFTPPDLGDHVVAVRVVDSAMQETESLITVTVTGTLVQQASVVLNPASPSSGVDLSPAGDAVRFTGGGKYGVRANQAIYSGNFWYFEASRVGAPSNMGAGLITLEGTLEPYGGTFYLWDNIGQSVSVNVGGPGTWHNLVARTSVAGTSSTFGFAVDYRGATPVVYVIVGSAVEDTIDMDDVSIPLYPMLYGNPQGTPSGTYDMTINFGDGSGASAFTHDPAAALSAAGVSTSGLEYGWGSVNQ